MPDTEVSDDVRAAFASLTASLEDTSAIAAEAQGVVTQSEAKERCYKLGDDLRVMLGELEEIQRRRQ